MNEITINKPLYGNYICIRDTILNHSIKAKEKLLVHIPNGSSVIDPYNWKIEAVKNARVMKKVFNYPSDPMILFCGYLQLPEIRGVIGKKEENNQGNYFKGEQLSIEGQNS